MSKSLTVSLVIPAYNEEQYIKKCLDSVAAQTIPLDEVIVVDNNSTDRTAEIVRKYPFVTLMHEHRQGLRYTRNTGMDAAVGDVIGRIDADSVLTPNWCERIHVLFSDSRVNAVTGASTYYDMPIKKFGLAIDRYFRKLAYAQEGAILYGSNMAVRKEAWHRIRSDICMDGVFMEDSDLTFHLRDKGYDIMYDPELIVSVSARRVDDSPRDFYRFMKTYDTTYAAHGQYLGSAKRAKYIFFTSYPLLKMTRRVYDPDKQRVTMRRVLGKTSNIARPTSLT